MILTNIGTVKEILSKHGFSFSKGLGQNFIINPDICPKIAENGNAQPGYGIIEIGTGIGVLTAELAKRADKVCAVEIDSRLLPILDETLAEYEQHIKEFCDRIIDRHCSPYEYTTLYVEHDGGQILVKKENVKSKEITVEYVLKLVEKDRKVYAGTYGKFAMCMQKLCKERGLTNKFLVYPTTYGIGVWLFYNFHAEENIADVKSLMDERGIEYYNEFSDHHWVYRFKVSKKRENIERMCA